MNRSSGADEPRPPWRRVVSIVKLRVGWAVFLECQGHLAFLDTLSPYVQGTVVTAEPGEAAPDGVGPKRMRCATCAGLPVRSSLRRKPHEDEIEHVLTGGDLPPHSPAWRELDRMKCAFVNRVRLGGVGDARATIAEAIGRGRRA